MSEYIYTGSKGEQIPVSKLQNSHLLNSLLKKTKEHATLAYGAGESIEGHEDLQVAIDALKEEVLRRMPIQ